MVERFVHIEEVVGSIPTSSTSMRGLTKLPDSYFAKFTNKQVRLYPFNPKSRVVAKKYILKLERLLSEFNLEIIHRGSTAFGIAGKGEIEIGVYPKTKDWTLVLKCLTKFIGKLDNLETNYARFNDRFQDFEVEIIVLKGSDAKIDRQLTEYLKSNSEVLNQYEKMKYQFAYSKKEYMIAKDKFFRKLVSKL